MKKMRFSPYFLLGIGTALTLQTNLRFLGPIGIGEIIILVFFCTIAVKKISREAISSKSGPKGFLPIYFTAVTMAVITPMTLYSQAFDVTGSSFRDLIAFYFCMLILITFPTKWDDFSSFIISFLLTFFMSIIVQYLTPIGNAWYYTRYTGGAKNPNQLALYLAAAGLFSFWVQSKILRITIILLVLFFGFLTGSDAFLVFILVVAGGVSLGVFFPARVLLFLLPAMVSGIIVIMTVPSLNAALSDLWLTSDEGGTRSQLYISAISAWFNNVLSFLFGNGAGSFSGYGGAFMSAEAHNTPLDLASVAGILGLHLGLLLPLFYILQSVYKGNIWLPAVFLAMVCFTFFHYVGRQPIYWITFLAFVRFPDKKQSDFATKKVAH